MLLSFGVVGALHEIRTGNLQISNVFKSFFAGGGPISRVGGRCEISISILHRADVGISTCNTKQTVRYLGHAEKEKNMKIRIF